MPVAATVKVALVPLAAVTTPEGYRQHFRLLRDALTAWMEGRTQPRGMPSYAEFTAGITAVLTALLNSPLAVRTILKLGPALKAGTVRITNLVKHADDAFEPFDEDQEKDRFLKLLDKVRRAAGGLVPM